MNKFLSTLILCFSFVGAGAIASPVTYEVSTSKTYFGSISGTITGEGSNLGSFNIIGTSDNSTYSFTDFTQAQIDAGAFAIYFPLYGYTDANRNPISEFFIENGDPSSPALATLTFYATGDFTTGLSYIGDVPTYNADGTPYLNGGQPGSATGPAAIQDASGHTVILDDLLLTLKSTTVVPEPSSNSVMMASLGLMLIGLGIMGKRVA